MNNPYDYVGQSYPEHVGCVPHVGNWWPLLLGLPLGAAGGYFLRRWQEPEAARAQVPNLRQAVQSLLPGGGMPGGGAPAVGAYPWLDVVGQDPYVGAYPWLDIVGNDPSVGAYPWVDFVGNDPSVGAYPWVDFVGNDPSVGAYPWLDVVGQDPMSPWVEFAPWVGAEADDAAKRQTSAHARALIQVAIQEVTDAASRFESLGGRGDANYWVWALWEPGPSPTPRGTSVIVHEPTQQITPVSTRDAAMEQVRELGQQQGVIARAVFDRTSRHWPTPTTWSTNPDPRYLAMIAQYVASRSSTNTAGAYVGAWDTAVGAAVDDVRKRAFNMAAKRGGDVIGVIHTVKDNLWHAIAFRGEHEVALADADDWLNTATLDQDAYTYAAYFDKLGDSWIAQQPYIEKIGGYAQRSPGPKRAPIVGATRPEIEAYRARAKGVATNRHGKAVVVLITSDNLAHSHAYGNLDEAIDALARVTGLPKASYAYAAAFDKASDGSAHIQQEEFGEAYVPIPSGAAFPRDQPATTSGEWGAW